MRKLASFYWFCQLAFCQTSPLDPKIPVSTLVREDVFAGFLSNDMVRFERGAKNIDRLLAERPDSRSSLLAWKGSTFLYRAVMAAKAGDERDFLNSYRDALLNFTNASEADPNSITVAAVTGGTYAIFADQLPEKFRKGAWALAYRAYQTLYKNQAPMVGKLPLHIKGELLAGLALTAQRTGKPEESKQHLSTIVQTMPGTSYQTAARKWLDDPNASAKVTLICLSCHDQGRLQRVSATH